MPRRITSLSLPLTLIAGIAATPVTAQEDLRSLPAENTAAAVADRGWKAPRTSWGHPSFEGVWTSDDMRSVPRNRPDEFAMRDSLTPEEFAQRAARDAAQRDNAVNQQTFSARGEIGVRTFGYTSQIIDPPTGRAPEMTEAGKARAARSDQGTFGPGPFDSVEDFTLYDRCITRGILGGVFPVVYGNGLRIVQNPNSIAISYEMIHDTRIIPVDGRPHIDQNIRQYLGNSRGRWEGDTLVIETRNLTDKTSIGPNGNGTRHSEQMKITERLTRVDPEMIEYVATVEDPVTYTAPFTVRLMLTTQPDYTIYEYSCNEGNQAVRNALSGERAYERSVREALAQGLPPPERIPSQNNLDPLPEDESAFFDINAGE
jgi:hypothetical protein